MIRFNLEIGDQVKYGDEDVVIVDKTDQSYELKDSTNIKFWVDKENLHMYNIPVRDEDMSGVTGNR